MKKIITNNHQFIIVLAPGTDSEAFCVARVVDLRESSKGKLKVKWYNGSHGIFVEYSGAIDTMFIQNILGRTNFQQDGNKFITPEDMDRKRKQK